MNRISETFKKLHDQKKKAIIPYITPEFPMKGTTVPLILAMEKAGASMIEVGVPFSDPLADGPTIQHSSHVAIQNGANIPAIFNCIKEARISTSIPIILMGYINPMIHFGIEKFIKEAKECGADGLIVPDLPPEESDEFRSLSLKYGISNIFLIAPTSTEKRIRFLDELSTDFTYCVSVTGVTGARKSFGNNFDEFLQRVKKNTIKPFVVGFGITSKEQIERISTTANGVVVGSALLQAMIDKTTIQDAVDAASTFFLSLQ